MVIERVVEVYILEHDATGAGGALCIAGVAKSAACGGAR